jgi:hypothetical protein
MSIRVRFIATPRVVSFSKRRSYLTTIDNTYEREQQDFLALPTFEVVSLGIKARVFKVNFKLAKKSTAG